MPLGFPHQFSNDFSGFSSRTWTPTKIGLSLIGGERDWEIGLGQNHLATLLKYMLVHVFKHSGRLVAESQDPTYAWTNTIRYSRHA